MISPYVYVGLSNILVNPKEKQIENAIIELVCDYYGLTIDVLNTRTREKEIVAARKLAMYLVRQYTGNTLKSIGERFGGFSHLTVYVAVQDVQDWIALKDTKIYNAYITISNKISKNTLFTNEQH